MEFEKWAPFPGNETTHEISDLGRCRIAANKKILSPYVKKDCGYVIIRLHKDGKKKEYKIHRMVGIAFIPNPQNKPEVNHLRGKLDNRAISLEWATSKENTNHAQMTGRRPIAKPKVLKGYPKGYKKVVNVETGEVYGTVFELSVTLGVSIRSIRRKLSGERRNDTKYRYLLK